MLKLPHPKDDGLFIPTVGEWSHNKHYFLMRYIDAFTTAMKNKKWTGLHYIDLFAGAGIDIDTFQWIRLYPIPYRDLDGSQKFKKYDIIEVRCRKSPDDHRAESYNPDRDSIKILRHLDITALPVSPETIACANAIPLGMAKSITSGSLPAGRCSWKSCHFTIPFNKKLHSLFPGMVSPD